MAHAFGPVPAEHHRLRATPEENEAFWRIVEPFQDVLDGNFGDVVLVENDIIVVTGKQKNLYWSKVAQRIGALHPHHANKSSSAYRKWWLRLKNRKAKDRETKVLTKNGDKINPKQEPALPNLNVRPAGLSQHQQPNVGLFRPMPHVVVTSNPLPSVRISAYKPLDRHVNADQADLGECRRSSSDFSSCSDPPDHFDSDFDAEFGASPTLAKKRTAHRKKRDNDFESGGCCSYAASERTPKKRTNGSKSKLAEELELIRLQRQLHLSRAMLSMSRTASFLHRHNLKMDIHGNSVVFRTRRHDEDDTISFPLPF